MEATIGNVMAELLTVLGSAAVTRLWLSSTPTNIIRNALRVNKWQRDLRQMVTCAECSGFWLGLIISLCLGTMLHPLLFASIAAVASNLLDRFVDSGDVKL